jgi:hypothetical protein
MSASSETSSPNKRRKLVEDIVDIDATPETGLAPNTVPDSSEGSGASADLVHPEPDIPSGPVKKNLWAQQCDVCQQNSGKYRFVLRQKSFLLSSNGLAMHIQTDQATNNSGITIIDALI